MMSSKGAATVSCPGFSSGFGGAFLSPTLAFSSGIAPFPLARLGACAEAVPSVATSAARYELSERIFLALHLVPKLEFVDVQRQIGLGNLVEGADDAALQQAPKAFNRLRVDRADNVLLGSLTRRSVAFGSARSATFSAAAVTNASQCCKARACSCANAVRQRKASR